VLKQLIRTVEAKVRTARVLGFIGGLGLGDGAGSPGRAAAGGNAVTAGAAGVGGTEEMDRALALCHHHDAITGTCTDRVVRCAFFGRTLHSRSAIAFHAFAPLQASRRVANGIPLG
jgi:hypothetical protein